MQESAAHHHWDEALAAAREFLERFPDSPAAGALQEQIGTLEANAAKRCEKAGGLLFSPAEVAGFGELAEENGQDLP